MFKITLPAGNDLTWPVAYTFSFNSVENGSMVFDMK
jgi:hypothetical protein